MQMTTHQTSDERVIRAAILNNVPLPPQAVARLEARGINVGELEQRLRQSMAWRV